MHCLSILTNWNPKEFCINIIPVELKTELESHLLQIKKEIEDECPEMDKIDITLEDIWFGSYGGNIVTDKYWKRGLNFVDCTGPSFSNRNEILKVISNKHDSKKLDVLIDGMEINLVPFLITRNFQEMIKPQLKQNELAVYYGGISWTEMTFELDIDGSFEESKLVFKFTDCGKHGYILNSITYDGEDMEKDYDPHKESFFDLKFFNKNHKIAS